MPAGRADPTGAPSPRSTSSFGRRRFALAAAAGLAVAGTGALASQDAPTSPTPAMTRLHHDRVLSYPASEVWPAALRYLRVDRGYALVDRDRDAGFILFDFPIGSDAHAPGRGSVELVETEDMAGRAAVSLRVSTDAGPSHLPHAIAEGLAAKLRSERGQPAPPPKPTPPDAPTRPEPDGPWAPEPPAPTPDP